MNSHTVDELVKAIKSASKRSSYQWSEGPYYSARDVMNEGRIELADELYLIIKELQKANNDERQGHE